MSRLDQLTNSADAEQRASVVRARLANSASGYVLVMRFGPRDHAAIRVLMEAGEAEIFDSPVGRAYRIKQKGEA